MSDIGVVTQYSTALPLILRTEDWIGDEYERQRIAAYDLYESMYRTVPNAFQLVQRGSESNPIYIPAPKTIVETLHRHLATGMRLVPDPAWGEDNDRLLASQVWSELFVRERFLSRFTANKRFGIVRGDWLFHIYADPNRPPGSRISILPLDPSGWFPIYNPDNVDEIIGHHIVEQFITDDGEARIRRLTYLKETGKGGPSPIIMSDGIYEPDDWGGPGMEGEGKLETVIVPPTRLPDPIDSPPIYHIKNFQETNAPYGVSELAGFERMFAGINQAITDEDLSLALDGLGVYVTSAGAPQDPDTGEDLPWNLGPGRVVERPLGTDFDRVNSSLSVSPYQDHLKYLHEQLNEASGSPNVARGIVDVSVAESGIALDIQFGPLKSRVEEKSLGIKDVLGNLTYDVGKWFTAYEGGQFRGLFEKVRMVPVFSNVVPTNQKGEIDKILSLYNSKLISGQTARERMRELGVEIPEETEEQMRLLGEMSDAAKVEADAIGNRIDGELNDVG